jgi:4-amino-4-deoxy-L-arabinose transferase-like glycosyltransferase
MKMISSEGALLNVRKIGLGIFALALTVRFLLLIFLPISTALSPDESEYLALAQNIRLHGILSFGAPHRFGEAGALNGPGPVLPTAARPPVFPFMVASLWWQDAPPFTALYVAQAILGAMIAWLVYSIALRTFNLWVAIIAGVGMALAPTSSALVLSVLTETLFAFLLTSCLWLWGRQQGFLAGLLLGAATLTRPVSLFLVLLVGVAGLAVNFNRALHLRIAVGAVLVIAPWTLRNAITQHDFIPVATYGWGSTPFIGTIDVPYGSGQPALTWFADKELLDIIATSPTETVAERRLAQAARERIVRDPLRWLWIRLKDYPRLFLDYGTFFMPFVPLSAAVVKGMFAASSVIFFLLSFCGIYLARKEWRRVYYLALIPLVLLILQFPAAAGFRYSVPILPMLSIFAALAISRSFSFPTGTKILDGRLQDGR